MSEPRRRPVVAIFGPTGVGKTAVAVALAELVREDGEDPLAVSADALQVYAGLETLTGVASRAERRRLEHRLVSFVAVDRAYSVGEHMPRAHAEIDAALAAGRLPIVVGGTGLYLRAALADLALRPPPAPGLRERLERALEERGPAALHRELTVRAPGVAAGVSAGDRSRIVRALEVAAGEDGSAVQPRPDAPSQLWTAEMRHPTLLFGLTMDRARLYERIDARVEAIVAAGGAEEAIWADRAGAARTARAALGFEELLRGDVEAMKRNSRRYAKRQLTWMRKLTGARIIDVTGRAAGDVARDIRAALRAEGAAVEAGEG